MSSDTPNQDSTADTAHPAPPGEGAQATTATDDDVVTYTNPLNGESFDRDPSISGVSSSLLLGQEDSDEEITRKLRRQGVRIGRGMIAPRVFWPALIVIVAVAAMALAFPQFTNDVFTGAQNWIVADFGWYYMLAIGFFVVFVVGIAFTKLGAVRLGRDDEKPEFGVLSWFAMLFSAGMGIGLIFYGVGEPLTYATTMPKPGWEGSDTELAGLAMAQTFVHWGLHPWAVYAVIGLALAFAIHRRGRPVSIRWALEPLFGERVKGWVGDVIDVVAIFGTVFGVATSLGLGVQQIASGMEAIGVVGESDVWLLVILILVITALAMVSVISGLGAGIKWLSNINLSLAGLLLISMLILGPTLFLLRNFVESLGVYLANVLQMTVDVGAYQGAPAQEWLSSWTIFYWGWWIAWAPFVGVFIARISRGRTVRQFIAGVLLVPTIVGFIWFSVMGGSGLFRQFFGEGDLVQDGEVSPEGVLFQVIGDLPLGDVLSVLTIIVVAIFFITSSDSGSLVVDMLASGGHPNPPVWSRVLWAVLEGALAITLLLAGGLGALQAGSLITALPFSIILILMCIATVRALRYEHRQLEYRQTMERLERVTQHVTGELSSSLEDVPELRSYVDDRIDYRLSRTRGIGRQGRSERPRTGR
ncbi:choline transporter [Pseudoclavibacter endophyticus]|nr:BCCT family transporter [Pseudoclavibacter endophyticus]GGA61968.1 choline transporter [Pseudoclavibacter endophyticus]